jgi:hypothetical protein
VPEEDLEQGALPVAVARALGVTAAVRVEPGEPLEAARERARQAARERAREARPSGESQAVGLWQILGPGPLAMPVLDPVETAQRVAEAQRRWAVQAPWAVPQAEFDQVVWARPEADPLADLREAYRLAVQHQAEQAALAAASRHLQEGLRQAGERLSASLVPLGEALHQAGETWYRQLAALVESGVIHLPVAARDPAQRVAALTEQVAELRALADCLEEAPWSEADLDPVWSDQAGLAQAGLLGPLVAREPPSRAG